MSKRSALGGDQTWREARGDFNVHLDSGKRVPHGTRTEHQSVCGFWFSGAKAVRRLTLDASLVSCKICRKKPAYTCRVLLLDAEVRDIAAVLLDYFVDHPYTSASSADVAVRPLIIALRDRRFLVDWLLQPDAALALVEARARVERFGQSFCDALVRQGNLDVLREPTLPLFNEAKP